MKQKKKGSIYRQITAMTVLPILILGMIVLFFCSARFTASLHEEIETQLKNISDGLLLTYDNVFPGAYRLVGNDKIVAFFKGEKEITGNFEIVDKTKEFTGCEITFFYMDTRMITTILDKDGNRLIGSGANTVICKDVLDQGKEHFYTHVFIDGNYYYAYYRPIYGEDGQIIGMLSVVKPASEVNKLVNKAIIPTIFITFAVMLLAGGIGWRYANNLSKAIGKLKQALGFVAQGNLSREPDYIVMSRNDEIGEMGQSVQSMQKALHVLIEKDALTDLYNRRFAGKKLNQILKKAKETGIKFCVSIGDIDFFKKVNDTYGHEMGDRVLKEVSHILKEGMVGKGFVARWGGEEFLLVFEGVEKEAAAHMLEEILDKIRSLAVCDESTAKETNVKVTMTFGVTQGNSESDIDVLLILADTLLYRGKTGGRNQVVYKDFDESVIETEADSMTEMEICSVIETEADSMTEMEISSMTETGHEK